jgi:hypothetical protein
MIYAIWTATHIPNNQPLHSSRRYGVKNHGLCFHLLYRQNFTVRSKSDRTDQFLLHCTSSRRRQNDCPSPRRVLCRPCIICCNKIALHFRFALQQRNVVNRGLPCNIPSSSSKGKVVANSSNSNTNLFLKPAKVIDANEKEDNRASLVVESHDVEPSLYEPGARFTNFQELFITRILNAILNRLRIHS